MKQSMLVPLQSLFKPKAAPPKDKAEEKDDDTGPEVQEREFLDKISLALGPVWAEMSDLLGDDDMALDVIVDMLKSLARNPKQLATKMQRAGRQHKAAFGKIAKTL